MNFDTTNRQAEQWAIVGGGMLGLTLAYRLAQAGQQVTLFEAAPEMGGLASAWQLGEVVWDRHYHVTLLSDTHLRRVLDELGLEKEIRWVETKTGFYTEGKHYSMSNNMEFLTFPPLSLWEKLRLGWTIFYASKIKAWRRLEKITVADWLLRLSGKGTFEKIWLPLLKAKLGSAYKKVSAGFIWAHINRMYRARRTGLKKEMFGYVPGGYARILDRMCDELLDLGVDIRLASPVEEIRSLPDKQVLVRSQGEASETFDKVVIAAPSSIVSQVCSQLPDEERRRHEKIEYLGILCSSVLLKRPLTEYYVTNITESWVPFTAVIGMTTIVDPGELAGHHLVYLPKYVTADDPAWQLSDEEIEERFLTAIERMYVDFQREDVLAFRTSRVKSVMALPTLDYSENLPPMKSSVSNLFAVNSAQIVEGNLNVNETIALAEQALQELLLPSVNLSSTPISGKCTDEEAASELVARFG
ncbi:MAG: NAD(P)/FAD-dependent oxidoreductase [Pirellulales bacterium]|nr:NAD(P)/FAD-dependent oxidoreductase [Pirellulales bacterium]